MHTHFSKVIDCFHRVLGINYSQLEICEVRTCRRHLLSAHDCDDLLNTFCTGEGRAKVIFVVSKKAPPILEHHKICKVFLPASAN